MQKGRKCYGGKSGIIIESDNRFASVISEHITITPETLAKQGIPGQIKEK